MIEVRNLSFHRPSQTRDDSGFQLSIGHFAVERGEKVAVVGPSGSGKTTLLNLIAGLLTPQAGTIQVADTDIGALNDSARRAFRLTRLGFIFQNFELIDYLTALDNILLPARIGRALNLTPDLRERAKQLATDAGLTDQLRRRPGSLSQGEQQRVALCRALLPGPDLILADEATGNLDPTNKTRILDLLMRQTDAEGATLLAVTHDHDLLPRFNRVVDFHDFRREASA